MSDETAVCEIDVTKKYIMVFDERLTMSEQARIRIMINEWLKSDMPFLLISGHGIRLIKIEEAEDE